MISLQLTRHLQENVVCFVFIISRQRARKRTSYACMCNMMLKHRRWGIVDWGSSLAFSENLRHSMYTLLFVQC